MAQSPVQLGSENVGTISEAITTDSCTDGSAFWMWDFYQNSTCSASTSEICFIGQGTATLGNYCRLYGYYNGHWSCLSYWGNENIGAYWPGDSGGSLQCSWGQDYFSDSTRQGCTTAGSCGQYAQYLYLSSN